jgi:hypothetical protein
MPFRTAIAGYRMTDHKRNEIIREELKITGINRLRYTVKINKKGNFEIKHYSGTPTLLLYQFKRKSRDD